MITARQFNKPLNAYRSEIADVRTGELSYRPFVHNLLSSFAKLCNDQNTSNRKVSLLHEQYVRRSGTPDFTFRRADISTFGYVECKKLNAPLLTHVAGEQVSRYAKSCDNVILTNGVAFFLVRDKKVVAEATIYDGPGMGNFSSHRMVDLLNQFASPHFKPVFEADTFANKLALLGNSLRIRLIDFLKDEVTPDSALQTVRDGYQKARGGDMQINEFADELAQTICHASLMAKLEAGSKDIQITARNMTQYIKSNFYLVRQICFHVLDELERKKVGHVKELLDFINLAEPKDLMRSRQSQEEMYMYFYEDFLATYNPPMRKKMGVYYTPKYVVEFIVKGIDDVLMRLFDKKKGLGDKEVMSLDFSTGTGAFLSEMVRKVLSKKGRLEKKLAKDHVLHSMFGFETMMPSYIIAQIRLYHLMVSHGLDLENHEKDQAGIVLTNTLTVDADFPLLNSDISPLDAMRYEVKRAEQIKQNSKIMVVAGNPPYRRDSVNTGTKYATIEKLLRSYNEIDGVNVVNGNIGKHLNNDYVKFIRYAQHKVDENKSGVVGIITCNGFLDNTFRGMRKSLMDSFETIYIINLHGDMNCVEVPPEGRTNENVFLIQTGVCICLFIKGGEGKKGIFYKDLWGPNDLRKTELEKASLDSIDWTKLQPYAPNYFFTADVPDEEKSNNYRKFPDVGSIFHTHESGLNAGGREKLAYHMDEKDRDWVLSMLHKRGGVPELADKFNLSESAENKAEKLSQFYRHYKIKDANKKKIVFRPFDERFTYIEGNSRGLVHGHRGKTRPHVEQNGNITLFTVKKPRDCSWKHVFAADKPLAIASLSNAAGHMFPLYLYDKKGKRSENLSDGVRRYLSRLYGKKLSAHDIMGYVYAVLHADFYRSEYEQLLSEGTDFPRIPFPCNIEVFDSLSDLGKNLLHAHVNKEGHAEELEVRGGGI